MAHSSPKSTEKPQNDSTAWADAELNALRPYDAIRQFCSLPYHEPSALHGRVGVVHKSHIITSPNMYNVPEIQWGNTEVRLRKDARFGTDDFTLWPQWHRDEIPYLACVPRKSSLNVPEEGKRFAAFWWTPTPEDLRLPGINLSSDFGFLVGAEMDAMESLKSELTEEANAVLTKMQQDLGMGAVLPTLLPSLGSRLSFMRHVWFALTDTRGNLENKRMELVDFQRAWLEVKGMVNYFIWKTKRWDSGLETMPECPEWVIGCIVRDQMIAAMFWRMGVPVWLVRDKLSVLRSGIHIERAATGFLKPVPQKTEAERKDDEEKWKRGERVDDEDDAVERIDMEIDLSFPVVYSDSPRSIAHYLAMQDFARMRSVVTLRTSRGHVLTDAESFNNTIKGARTTYTELSDLRARQAASLGGIPSPSTSTSVPAAGGMGKKGQTTIRVGSARNAPYNARGKAKKANNPSAPVLVIPPGTFEDVWISGAPDLLPPWPKATSRMDVRVPRGNLPPKLLTFPPSNIFFTKEGDFKNLFLQNWLHIRPIWLSKVARIGEGAPHLKVQTWRDMLLHGVGTPEPKLIHPGSDTEKNLMAGLSLCGLTSLGNGTVRFKDGDLLAPHPGRVTGARLIHEVDFDGEIYNLLDCTPAKYDRLVRMMLWELHELNFRYDLQLLDAVFTNLDSTPQRLVERQNRLKACWGLGAQLGYDPTTTFISQFDPFAEANRIYSANDGVWCGDKKTRREYNEGFASADWAKRLPRFRALYDVVATWRVDVPSRLGDFKRQDLSRAEFLHLEELLADTLMQWFFDSFRREMVSPRRMWSFMNNA